MPFTFVVRALRDYPVCIFRGEMELIDATFVSHLFLYFYGSGNEYKSY
jgi:hypothetical protein